MRRYLVQSWFLVALCLLLAMGIGLGDWLSPLADQIPKPLVIGLVMLTISLATDFRQLLTGRGNWIAVGLAIAVNVLLAPPLGWLFGHALTPGLAHGLIVAMAVPCTVASAIVWTRRGNGNDVAAAAATLVTNFACFLVLPFWTGLLLGEAVDVRPGALAAELLMGVAAPMLAGQLLRRRRPIAKWADSKKAVLGLAAQCGVLLMALLGAVKAGEAVRSDAELPAASDWALLLAVVATLHVALLLAAWLLARSVGLAPPERLTVLIAGSQKTMAVGLSVAAHFGPLALFPLVAYHFTQLLLDTVLVDWWKRRD